MIDIWKVPLRVFFSRGWQLTLKLLPFGVGPQNLRNAPQGVTLWRTGKPMLELFFQGLVSYVLDNLRHSPASLLWMEWKVAFWLGYLKKCPLRVTLTRAWKVAGKCTSQVFVSLNPTVLDEFVYPNNAGWYMDQRKTLCGLYKAYSSNSSDKIGVGGWVFQTPWSF